MKKEQSALLISPISAADCGERNYCDGICEGSLSASLLALTSFTVTGAAAFP